MELEKIGNGFILTDNAKKTYVKTITQAVRILVTWLQKQEETVFHLKPPVAYSYTFQAPPDWKVRDIDPAVQLATDEISGVPIYINEPARRGGKTKKRRPPEPNGSNVTAAEMNAWELQSGDMEEEVAL